jgi:hypothetical protein
MRACWVRRLCSGSGATTRALAAAARSSSCAMGVWLERSVAALSACLAACAVTAADSLPASQAENAPSGRGGSGQVRTLTDPTAMLRALETAVRADAVARLGLAPSAELKTVSSEVTWSDGSLGCARQGQSYTMALEPGWKVVVNAPGRPLTYHASRRGLWLLCEGGSGGHTVVPRTVDR